MLFVIFGLLVLYVFKDGDSQCIFSGMEVFENTAVIIYDNAVWTLHCYQEHISWTYYRDSVNNEGKVVFSNVSQTVNDKYSITVEKEDVRNKFSITAFRASFDTAGWYSVILRPHLQLEYFAELIIIERPACKATARDSDLAEIDDGTRIDFECSTNYTGVHWIVGMEFSIGGELLRARAQAPLTDTVGTVKYIGSFTVKGNHHKKNLTVVIYIMDTPIRDIVGDVVKDNIQVKRYSRIPPTLKKRFPIRSWMIRHGTSTVNFVPSNQTFFMVNDTIKCIADGNPEPNIVWEKQSGPDDSNSVVGNNLKITLTSGRYRYRCNASNEYKGRQYVVSNAIEFTVVGQENSASSGPSPGLSTTETVLIIVFVNQILVILILIMIIIWYRWKVVYAAEEFHGTFDRLGEARASIASVRRKSIVSQQPRRNSSGMQV